MIETVLTGLAYVFAVLTAIVLFIVLLSLIARAAGAVGKRKKKRADVKIITAERTVLAAENETAEIEGTDPRIICAITAAIDAFEAEKGKSRFRILSFRRVGRD